MATSLLGQLLTGKPADPPEPRREPRPIRFLDVPRRDDDDDDRGWVTR